MVRTKASIRRAVLYPSVVWNRMKRFALMQAVQTLTTFQTVKPLVPMAEPDRLQPGESVAAAGATEEDRELVVDEFAATAG